MIFIVSKLLRVKSDLYYCMLKVTYIIAMIYHRALSSNSADFSYFIDAISRFRHGEG